MLETDLVQQTADAYEHLYDLVYLRTHPLADLVAPGPTLPRKEKAWRLHRTLLALIDDLDPGPQAPAFSHEWRRHRLMVLRYLDGADPQAIADQIGVSRRHYYRELESAAQAIAALLWERFGAQAAQAAVPAVGEGAAGLELLRLEAARMAQAGRYARVGEVAAGVASLLQEVLRQRALELVVHVPRGLPGIPVDGGLLRQMLLAMLGYLIERAERATVRLEAGADDGTARLTLRVEPPEAVRPAGPGEEQERLSALEQMANLMGASLTPQKATGAVTGFDVALPARPERTILVVDDNEDVLSLFQRYLAPHQFRVVAAQTAREALAEARRLQPHAITLDLMMPGRDGWDVLQTLLNQPDTRHIPIVVCSVLKQKDLALSLGATAFLEKPVSEQALLAVLEALEAC